MDRDEDRPPAPRAGAGHRRLCGFRRGQGLEDQGGPSGRQPELPVRGRGGEPEGEARNLHPRVQEGERCRSLSLRDRGPQAGFRRPGELHDVRPHLPDRPRPVRQRRPVQRFRGQRHGEGEPRRAVRPPRRRPPGGHRPPGLHRRPGRDGPVEHAAAGRQRPPRLLPRLRLLGLLPHRPALRLQRTVPGDGREGPREGHQGHPGRGDEPLQHRALVDAGHAVQGLGPYERPVRELQPPDGPGPGPERFQGGPRHHGGRLVRAEHAGHEPGQSLHAEILPAVGRVVDRVFRPGRLPRGHLVLQ